MSARKSAALFVDDRPLHERLDAPVDAPIPFALEADSALPLLGGKPVRAASIEAQAKGDDAEDEVEKIHESLAFATMYRGTKLSRRYPKRILKFRREGGRSIPFLQNVSQQGPDFGGGIVVDGGAALWCEVEVKVVNPSKGERLDLPRFTEAEVELLSACRAAGGVAVVLLIYGESLARSVWCGCPWALFEERHRAWGAPRRPGSKAPPGSIPASEFLAYAVKHRVEYLQRSVGNFPRSTR